MTAPICEIEGAAVVLLGNFNPALVHPAWLARHKLVRDSEADAADVNLVRPELSVFSVGPFRVEAQPERFTVMVDDLGNLGPLQDLVSSVFTILGQTPITKFGLNRHMHFRMESADSWHKVGHTLAPKKAWDGVLDGAGTRSLTVWGKWPTTQANQVQVVVEPSQRVVNGVYVSVAAQFDLSGSDTSVVIEAMRSNWDECFDRARKVAEVVVAIGSTEESI
jgi:hypothetical protein